MFIAVAADLLGPEAMVHDVAQLAHEFHRGKNPKQFAQLSGRELVNNPAMAEDVGSCKVSPRDN